MPLSRGLLIGCKRNFEQAAASEIHFTLTEKLDIPKSDVRLIKTRISGLVAVSIKKVHDLIQIMDGLMKLEASESYFLHCLKIRPIMEITKIPENNFDSVRALLPQLIDNRDPASSYKLEIYKRHSQLNTVDIIGEIAPHIPFKVDLSNPDWILLVEIMTDQVGISTISPQYIFSTNLAKIKEDKSENWFLN